MLEHVATRHRILVVDDNEDAATTLAFLLAEAGYEVRAAFSGKEALEVAMNFHPDVCIIDINMPGMSGYELARRIRSQDVAHCPVLATLTAYSDVTHLDRAANAGFDLHFTKPMELSELVEQIEDSMSRHAD